MTIFNALAQTSEEHEDTVAVLSPAVSSGESQGGGIGICRVEVSEPQVECRSSMLARTGSQWGGADVGIG